MRLQRVGRKNDPSYRVVVVDKRTGPKSNKNIDILGSYNPKLGQVQIDADKAKDWLTKGVQPSDTVHNILVAQKVIEGKKINALPKKSPIVDDSEAAKAASETPNKAEEEAKAKEEKAKADAEAAKADAEAPAEDKVKAEGGEGDLGQVSTEEASPAVEEETKDDVSAAEVETTDEEPKKAE